METLVDSKTNDIHQDHVAQENQIVTCSVCYDDVGIQHENYIVACCDNSHPGFHRECLGHYIESKVSEGFPGACPCIYCPCIHADKRRKVLRYTSWKSIINADINTKFQANADSLLAFLCSNCHVLRSITVPYSEEDRDKALEFFKEKLSNTTKYENLLTDINEYNCGLITVLSFYDKLSEVYFPEFQTEEDKNVWIIFKQLLQIFDDPERRANLHLRHLKNRPRMWTPCCQKEHCFRCRTKDFHTGKTCEQNTNTLDSTIVPCPSCGLFLTKGDGCNSVTCVCGKKFSWNEEKETNERTTAFMNAFPIDTSASCAKVLCQTLEGNETNALAWRARNTIVVNQAILRHWKTLYPHCPNQAIALLDSTKQSQGRQIVIEVWESKHVNEVKKCKSAIEAARDSLFLSMYPTQSDRFHGARRLLASQSITSRNDIDSNMRIGAKAWVSKNSNFYDHQMQSWRRESGMKFIYIFGVVPFNNTIPGRFNLPSVESWNTEISNTSLVFTNNSRTVKRPGSVSSYPAAFASIPASRSTICVEIDAAFVGPNWLTFGLARRGMEVSGSDGVGLTADTWGISDERDSSSEAVIASCGSRIGRCRKFRQGDIVKGVVDLAAGWFEVSIGIDSFTHRFEIPPGSCDDYYFAMTFANNHQVTIVCDPYTNHAIESGNVPNQENIDTSANSKKLTPTVYHLNNDQSEMFFNLKNLISDICKNNDSSPFDHEFLATHSSIWESFVVKKVINASGDVNGESLSPEGLYSKMSAAFEKIRPYIELLTKDGRSTEAGSITEQSDVTSFPTWNEILGACCWSRLNQERLENERQVYLSEDFILEHGDSASFMAAVALAPNMIESLSREHVAKAKAYMKLNIEEMQSWYDYNAVMTEDLGESLIPGLENIPRECRCLPRHVKVCPLSRR